MAEIKRDQTLDALKGVAIFLVMAGHVLNLNHMEDAYVYDFIKVVQMPLFMMVSGCLCGMGRRVDSVSSYVSVLKRRAVSYLVPFFTWVAVLYPTELPGAFVDTLFHLDYGLWFLMTLFLLTVMVYTAQLASSLAGNRAWLRELLFWGVYGGMAAFVLLQTLLGWEFLSPALTRLYIPFYMAGYTVKAYGAADHLSQRFRAVLAVLAALILGFLIVCYDLVDLSSPAALLRQILASFAGCYVIFWLCRRWKDGRSKRAAAWLGTYTLEIYALHFHFATLLNRGTSYELYSWSGLLFVLASFAVMSVLTAAIIFITKKIRILNFLLYGKRSDKAAKSRPKERKSL